MKKLFAPNKGRLESGQSLVEMSIGMVVLVILVSGLLDLGRLYFIRVALEDGAGEAVLYLALHPECPTAESGPTCADPNNAVYRARHSGSGPQSSSINLVDWRLATVYISGPPAIWGVGETVEVRIEYPYRLLTPFVPKITGLNPMTLYVSASSLILEETP